MSLFKEYEKLFDSKEDADVTFIIQNQELQAHKLILTTQSPVFKAMIKGPMAPPDQRHLISDPQVGYEDFSNFLKFLYIEKCDITVENVEVLLHLKIPKVAPNLPMQYEKEGKMVWISPELVLEVIKQCPRSEIFTEDTIFDLVFGWSKGQCETQNLEINAENLQKITASFISYLNPPNKQ
uniref:BTB domain-containing protein n=1 Tax=Panagrolaimus sp. ES5 TaxID=591445 RepID=A0AC34G7N0_9BILA